MAVEGGVAAGDGVRVGRAQVRGGRGGGCGRGRGRGRGRGGVGQALTWAPLPTPPGW